MTIVFRCNVGPGVGLGHLVRSRTLAAILRRRGARCAMFGPADSYRQDGDDALFDDWHASDWSDAETDARALAAFAKARGGEVAVVDDYRADAAYQLILKDAGLRWMQQFDASRPPPFWADFVVNGGPYERAEHYADHTRNPRTEFLLGPTYSVLRPEFAAPPVRAADRPVRRVLVSFGGGDDHGLVIRSLESLLAVGPPDVVFRVMSGRHNPRNADIARWMEGQGPRVSLVVDPGSVLTEYLDADAALLAGGTSTFEGAATGLPMLLIATASNQIRQCTGWQDVGAAVFMGPSETVDFGALARQLNVLCSNGAKRASMTEAGRRSVDGQGGERLADRLLGAMK